MPAILLILLSLIAAGNCQQFNTSSQEFIDYINNLNTTWTAQMNFPNMTDAQLPRCGSILIQNTSVHEVQMKQQIPQEFDARTRWSNCQTIGLIHQQGECGSCWV